MNAGAAEVKHPINRRFVSVAFWMITDCVLALAAVASAAIPLRLDTWPPLAFLTYPPRLAVLIVLLPAAAVYACKRNVFRLCVAIISIVVCLASLDWGRFPRREVMSKQASLTLLSMNTHGQPAMLPSLLSEHRVAPDVLVLQELPYETHAELKLAFPKFEFYAVGDIGLHSGPGTCIGLRASKFDTDSVVVVPAVSGYRSFAITVIPNGQAARLAIVNVHTTKALAFHAGVIGYFTETPSKSYRHMKERRKLEEWTEHFEGPVVLAGDFNAPSGTMGVRLSGTRNAHTMAGDGLLLTFPSTFPLVGIDHVLGTQQVAFVRSRVLDGGFSDHCARLVQFRIRAKQLQ